VRNIDRSSCFANRERSAREFLTATRRFRTGG
jgi:hypothetical protein